MFEIVHKLTGFICKKEEIPLDQCVNEIRKLSMAPTVLIFSNHNWFDNIKTQRKRPIRKVLIPMCRTGRKTTGKKMEIFQRVQVSTISKPLHLFIHYYFNSSIVNTWCYVHFQSHYTLNKIIKFGFLQGRIRPQSYRQIFHKGQLCRILLYGVTLFKENDIFLNITYSYLFSSLLPIFYCICKQNKSAIYTQKIVLKISWVLNPKNPSLI